MELYRLFSGSGGEGEYYYGLFKTKKSVMDYIKKEILNDDWNAPESVSDEDFIISEREWDNPNHIFFDVLFYKNKEHFGDEDWEDGSFTYEIINIDDLT